MKGQAVARTLRTAVAGRGSAWRLAGLGLLCMLAALASPQTFAHGDLQVRLNALTRQIQTATNNPAGLYLERGELERDHGQWKQAAADYARAAELDPSLARVDLCRAKLLADSGQVEAALALFDKVVARSPAEGEAYLGRARTLVKLSRRQLALADYQHGLSLLKAPAPEDYLEWAQHLAAEGELEAALGSVAQGIQKLGPLVELERYAVELEVRQKHYAAAATRLETILPQVLRKERWLADQGKFWLAAGRPDAARQSWTAALAAVKRLPPRLQQGIAMRKLQAEVEASLAALASGQAKAQ